MNRNHDVTHHGSDTKGNDYSVVVTPGKFFRAYDVKGEYGLEVTVTEGYISVQIDDIKTPAAARAWAALLLEAADELEEQLDEV